jgi:ribosome-binding ATPase YchF (GTP1/OBG family)
MHIEFGAQAAGCIHSDIEKHFIKAEVVSFEEFKAITTKPSMGEVKVMHCVRLDPTFVYCTASQVCVVA